MRNTAVLGALASAALLVGASAAVSGPPRSGPTRTYVNTGATSMSRANAAARANAASRAGTMNWGNVPAMHLNPPRPATGAATGMTATGMTATGVANARANAAANAAATSTATAGSGWRGGNWGGNPGRPGMPGKPDGGFDRPGGHHAGGHHGGGHGGRVHQRPFFGGTRAFYPGWGFPGWGYPGWGYGPGYGHMPGYAGGYQDSYAGEDWDGTYTRPSRGYRLPGYFVSPRFFISNWGYWGLRQPPYGYHWVRYYDDAVLIDQRGNIYDTAYGLDWDRDGTDGLEAAPGDLPPRLDDRLPPAHGYHHGYDSQVTDGTRVVGPGVSYVAPGTTVVVHPGTTTTTTTTYIDEVVPSRGPRRRGTRSKTCCCPCK